MKKTVKGLSILLLAGLVMAFAGCSASEDTSETPAAEVSVEITSTVTQVYKGFNGGKITLTASVKNATDSTVTWSSSNEAAATVDSDGVVTAVSAGDATITATASGKTASVEITVKEASVGDIIYTTDGGNTVDIADSASYDTADTTKTPVAVVAGFSESGNVLGLGLKISDLCCWANTGTTGYSKEITNIVSSFTGDYTSGYTFSDDKDGSDNWSEICKVDTNAETNIANYPAFNFAVNYGTTMGYKGDLASGWYVPSIYELWQVCQNRTTLSTTIKTWDSSFSFTVYHWSSSQVSDYAQKAYACKFSDGSLTSCDFFKNADTTYTKLSALVVRQF